MAEATATAPETSTGLIRGLGLLDSTMLVAGSMIGSGIFIVSAEIAQQVGSPGWLLVVWVVAGVLTIIGALSYGELAAMMPKAGGQYVYLREAFSPLWGFLYGWTFFLVIQTGTIAAVAVGFSRYLGVFWKTIAENNYLIAPQRLGSSNYALSLSTAQLVGVCLIVLLTWINTRGLRLGKLVQNTFTLAKTGALIGLIVLGLTIGWNATAASDNFHDIWRVRPDNLLKFRLGENWGEELTALTAFGLFVGICVAQTNSLFSADSWHNVTFTAGEVKNPSRNLPLSLALGTILVISLYLLANLAYLAVLPFKEIQASPRVASRAMEGIFKDWGAMIMAAAIMVSTFGCNNGLVLAGSRLLYAMSLDGLFFRGVRRLNAHHVPARAMIFQGIWAACLILPRTITEQNPDGSPKAFGNLYGNLLDYVISAALIFYILTVLGLFRLRQTRPDAERPYRAFGYPVLPLLYVLGSGLILLVLFLFKPSTTLPGLVIVATGFPIYFLWRRTAAT
jgi:basic amino acid/polyamine antiporter, APA family